MPAPRCIGDDTAGKNAMTVFADGSRRPPSCSTGLRSAADLKPAEAENKRCGIRKSARRAASDQLEELLFAIEQEVRYDPDI